MPDEEYLRMKRKAEDSRDRDRKGSIYDDNADTKLKIFNYTAGLLFFIITVVCIIVPLFGLALGILDFQF